MMSENVVEDKLSLNRLFGSGGSPKFYLIVVVLVIIIIGIAVLAFSTPRFLDIMDYSAQKFLAEGEAKSFMREQGWVCECESGVMFLLGSELSGQAFPIPICDTGTVFVRTVCEAV